MNILVFTGAGLSKPLGLPTTDEFNGVINSVSYQVSNLLKDYLQKGQNDIEYILSELDKFQNQNDFISHIIKTGMQRNGNYEAVISEINRLKEEAKLYSTELKRGTYQILQNFNESNSISLYINLIKQLKQIGDNENCISFFTTNYDLTFETSVEESFSELEKLGIKEINYGFRDKYNKSFFNNESNFQWESDVLEYKKIHGSLDWFFDRNKLCCKTGTTNVPLNPDTIPLLYPGYKEIPTTEPFKSLHDQLLSRILQADLVIVIGFAFRDPYINSIFETSLKLKQKNQQFLCFNPSKINELPKESNLKKLIQHENFKHIEKGISIEDKPLDYKFS